MEIKTYCILCTNEIPPERAAKKSNTCCDACKKKLKTARREAVDERRCRHCHRPSTPEERRAFLAFYKQQPNYAPKGRPRKKKKAEPAPGEQVTNGEV